MDVKEAIHIGREYVKDVFSEEGHSGPRPGRSRL